MTVSNGTCTPATSTFTLTIDSVPYASPATVNTGEACASAGSFDVPTYNFGPNGNQVGLISWTSSGDGSFVDNTVANPTYTFGINDQIGGVVTLTMTVSNGTCTPATSTFTLTIDSVPSATQGTPNSDQVCASVGSYTIQPSYGYGYGPTTGLSTGVITWTSSSNGTITNPHTLSPTYTLSTYDSINGGTVILTMSVTNGTCTTPATTTFSLGIYPFPYDTVGPPQDICASSVSQPLGGNTSQFGTGLWTQVNGPVGGITTFVNGGSSQPANTLGNSSAGVSAAGQYVYAWTITTGPGCSLTKYDTITYHTPPTTAHVGPNQTICGSLVSNPLGGNNPTIGNGKWSLSSGPGSVVFNITGVDTGNATATVSTPGLYTFLWTITNGNVCTPSTDSLKVNYLATPTGGSIPTVTYCSSADSATVAITGASGANNYTWNLPAGLTGYSTSSSITVGGTVGGSYTVTATPYNLTCPGTQVTGTVTIIALPTTATVGATQNLCGTLTSGSLGGNTPTVGTGAWTKASGPGTATFSNASSGSSTVTVSLAGTYTFTWTISNGICAPSTATTTVVFVPTPSGGNITTVNYCSSADSATVSVTGVSNATQYVWALPAGLSGYSTTSNITVGGTVGGSYTVTVTPYNGTCVGTPVTGTVNIIALPTTATVGATQNLCGTLTSGSLGGNTPTVGTGAWTQTSGPGITTFSAPTSGSSTATATVPGTYTYTWTISNGICAPNAATTTVVFTPTPSGGSIATVNYCSSADSATVSVTGVSNATQYVWALPAGLSGTSTTSDITVGGTVGGTYIVTVTPYNGACVGTPVTGTVNIVTLPTTAQVGPTQTLCGLLTSGPLGGNTPTVGTGAWSQTAGPGTTTFSTPTGGLSTATATVPGIYAYTWTISNGICAPSTATVNVNFQAAPSGGSIAAVTYCSSNDTATVTVAGVSNATQYVWSLPANLSGTSTSASILVGGTVPGVYTVTVTPWNNGGTCSGTPITGTVTIEALPVIDSVLVVGPACVGASTGSITVFATSTNGSLTYSINGGVSYPSSTGLFTNVSAGSYSVYVKDAGTCKAAYAANPILITKPINGLVVTDARTDAKCNGADNGSIQLLPSGGGGAYTFRWSNGDTTQLISGLSAGAYTATVTDARGCSATLSDSIKAPNLLTDTIKAVNLSCTGTKNGSATVIVSGGTAPYSYLWSNFATSDSIGGLDAGVYNVLITDVNGCRGTGSVTINGSGHLTANLTAGPDVVLAGDVVHLYANAVSDTSILSYVWTPVDSLNFDSCGGVATSCGNPTANPTVTQDYSVVVTDAHGCSVTTSVNVTVSDVPLLFMPTAFSPNGDGLNDFFTFDILGAKSVNVQVWNRWGEEVYSVGNVTNGTPTWDGTYRGQPAQIDTYTYQLDVTYFNGVRKTIAGTITLTK